MTRCLGNRIGKGACRNLLLSKSGKRLLLSQSWALLYSMCFGLCWRLLQEWEVLDDKTRKPVAGSMTIISRYQNWNWSRCWKMAIQPDRSFNTDWNQPNNVNHRCVIQVINFLCSPFIGCLSQFFLWTESYCLWIFFSSFSMHIWNFYQFCKVNSKAMSTWILFGWRHVF